MKTIIKWAALASTAVALLAAGAWVFLWLASERTVEETFDRPATKLVAAAGPEAVSRGAWLARTRGCTDCHGAGMQGRRFHDDPPLVTLWAPNVTRIAATYTDADLDRAIRHGVSRGGRGLFVMPSSTFSRLTDGETADLIAWLRTLPQAGSELPRTRLGGLGRLGVALGKFRSEPRLLATARLPSDLGAEHAWARHFVSSACSECHGPALEGSVDTGAPDLNVAGGYSSADFARLLRTGTASGGRRLGLMSEIAPDRYSGLSDSQIAAIHAYLRARAEAAPAT